MPVQQLKIGSIIRDGDRIVDARSSVTLVEEGKLRIIVDTGTLGEDGILIDALSARGLSPSDIDIVVNTHLHLDHCGCNLLFRKAIFYADRKENPPMHFQPTPDGKELCPGVQFLSTPGHTTGSISLQVTVEGKIYVIAGDAIPTFENYEKMTPPSVNIDLRLAIESMKRIIERADHIVPGHGALFEATR